MAAEGEPFQLRQSMDTTGLAGVISSSIRWGDGQQSAGIVEGGTTSGNVRFRFDYSLDASGFFSDPIRRSLLEAAGAVLTSKLADNLAAIQPSGANTWTPKILHPSTGTNFDVPGVVSVNANEILVFAGARNMGSAQLAEGGYGGSSRAGSPQWMSTVATRGQTGAALATPTDFGPWGGFIAFNTTTDFFYGASIDGIPSNHFDFFTIATHELAHVLGFGTAPVWNTYRSGQSFTGPRARAAFDGQGNVPLTPDLGHWTMAVRDDGRDTLMQPIISSGTRKTLTPLDLAALGDMGWQLLPTQTTVIGSHVYASNGVYPIEVVLRGSQAGEIVRSTSATIVNAERPLTLSLDRSSIAENAGVAAATLTVGRPAASTGQSVTVQLGSSDLTEATVPPSVVIAAGIQSVTVPINAIDDTLLDGSQSVTLTATATGYQAASVNLTVTDHETITGTFSAASIREDAAPGSFLLTLRRSNTDVAAAITVSVSGNVDARIDMPRAIQIPAGSQTVEIPVLPINDSLSQRPLELNYEFSAVGYVSGRQSLILLDDDPPGFQNPVDRFDSDGDGEVTLVDALRVANLYARRVRSGEPLELDPERESPAGLWPDVDGDYTVSLLDSLLIVNELRRRFRLLRSP